jgi:hypothetical protein
MSEEPILSIEVEIKALAAMPLCVVKTPFGFPDVPEVVSI